MSRRIPDVRARRRLSGAVLVLTVLKEWLQARPPVAGGLLLAIGLLVVAIVVQPCSGGGDGDGAKSKSAAPVVRTVKATPIGLTFTHPSSWTRKISGRVVRLRAPDGTAIMTFASPTAGRQREAVLRALDRGLRSQFPNTRLVRLGDGRLGGLPAISLELLGGRSDARVRMLALIAASSYRTYAVTLITPARPSRRRLAEVQDILSTVSISKPQAARPAS